MRLAGEIGLVSLLEHLITATRLDKATEEKTDKKRCDIG